MKAHTALIKARERRWQKAERPYYRECLTCNRSCSQTIQYAAADYTILSCPRQHKGNAMFPYKLEEMKKQEEERKKHMEEGKDG